MSSAAPVPIRAKGALAEAVVRARSGTAVGDVTLEAVSVDDLVAGTGAQADGWPGPPWVREGWFHARLLLAPGLDATEREDVDQLYEQLVRGRARLVVFVMPSGPNLFMQEIDAYLGEMSGWVPAFELGLGGGARVGIVLRQGINARR